MSSIRLARQELEEFPILSDEIIRITLENNFINNIPEDLSDKIKTLNLKRNKITCIKKLPKKLSTLILSFNNLSFANFLFHERLTYVDLSYNHIIKVINLPIKLKVLDLTDNSLTEIPENLPNTLTKLILTKNYIEKIEHIPESIEILDLSANMIKEVTNISENLKHLYLSNNQIDNFHIDTKNLEKLDLSFNFIKTLNITSQKIKDLYVHYNRLVECSIDIISLETLDLSFNSITHPPSKISPSLIYLDLENNNIDYIPARFFLHPKLKDFFYDERCLVPMIVNDIQKIYDDDENTHSHSIQENLRTSVNNLLTTEKINIHDIFERTDLTTELKDMVTNLIYTDNMQFGNMHVMLSEIFFLVINRIDKHTCKEEILKIMENDLSEAYELDLCPIGKISRIINSLCGFCDDIIVNISESEQISNVVVSIIRKNLPKQEEKDLVIKELKERNISDSIIHNWVSQLE